MDIIINAECASLPSQKTTSLVSQGSVLLNLLSCFGYESTNPPLAALLAQYYQLEGDWLILNPVQWQATHNNAAIVAYGKELEISESELKTLFQNFSEFLKSIGLVLYYHDQYTWLLSTSHHAFLKTKPVQQMLGKPLSPELASMDETMYWQKFLTESQMFFSSYHPHSVVNGIWLWGNGVLSKKNKKIVADEHLLKFAQLCCISASLYESTSSLKECDLLLLSDISVLNKTHQEQLKQREICWYWNNNAYTHSPVSWFTQWWRALFHAH